MLPKKKLSDHLLIKINGSTKDNILKNEQQ